MSLLGKILAVLNILGAAGFVALASMDYAKRQAWSYAVLRNEFMVEGLPLDKSVQTPEGQPVHELLSETTLREMFPGGNPVATQEEEVARVQSQAQNRIQQLAAGSKRGEVAAHAHVLLPLAVTNLQRERYLSCRTWLANDQAMAAIKNIIRDAYTVAAQKGGGNADKFKQAFYERLHQTRAEPTEPFAGTFFQVLSAAPQKPFDTLFDESLDVLLKEFKAQLDNAFGEARGQRVDAKGTVTRLAPVERRTAIARLLFALAGSLAEQPPEPSRDLVDDPAYRRYITVVGLREAVAAIDAQAEVLSRILYEFAVEQDRERSRFVTEHAALIEEIRNRAEEVRIQYKFLEQKKKERDDQEEIVKRRRRDVQQYEEELTASRKLTAEQLKKLRDLSQALFETRVQLRDDLEGNQKKVRTIRKLEEDR